MTASVAVIAACLGSVAITYSPRDTAGPARARLIISVRSERVLMSAAACELAATCPAA